MKNIWLSQWSLNVMSERDEWIRERAYALWEQAGRPDGLDSEHWGQANAEWEAGERQGRHSAAGARLINDYRGRPTNADRV